LRDLRRTANARALPGGLKSEDCCFFVWRYERRWMDHGNATGTVTFQVSETAIISLSAFGDRYGPD
jgi:hypothetical protein